MRIEAHARLRAAMRKEIPINEKEIAKLGQEKEAEAREMQSEGRQNKRRKRRTGGKSPDKAETSQ